MEKGLAPLSSLLIIRETICVVNNEFSNADEILQVCNVWT
jgi:hypothetical protein